MKINIIKTFPKNTKLVVIITNDNTYNKDLKKLLPSEIESDFKRLVNKSRFDGKANEHFLFHSTINKNSIEVLLIGTGNKKNQNNEIYRNIGNTITKNLTQENHTNITICSNELNEQAITSTIEGLILGNYKFDKYVSDKKKHELKLKNIVILTTQKNTKLNPQIKNTLETALSINYVRDLVNSPPIDVNPTHLAERAKEISKSSNKITLKILNEKEIKKSKMGLIAAVSSGSGQESKLIILEYKNKPANKKPIMLVGKGVTFDAGGLNLKIQGSIEGMKMDMAGGATVLGVFNLLSKLNPLTHVIGIIPAVENLVGADAYKPDDILTAFNGKTVEITNTDAEGRLILADAISYGIKKYKPELVIDLATLTGACITALGYTRAGLYSNNKELRGKMQKLSISTGNKTWPLPIDDFHREKVKGEISDYKNYTGSLGAGSILAAAFLEQFVEKTPWIHLDIAGVAFLPTEMGYRPKGATGDPLKLIYEFISKYKA